MNILIFSPLILTFVIPAISGVYHYPLYREGIEVRCKDGKPNRLVEITDGRGMKLLGHGEEQYSWPIIYLYPETSNDRYKYFPSTAGTQCSYRKLTPSEKADLIGKSFGICLGDELVTRKQDCYGWD
tara:strand:- start:283 stop:663 length:381 start_codon:yes stop_codon:yes gene_type:complete